MKPQRTSEKISKPKSTAAEYTVREKREAPELVIQRQRSELLKKMMERARTQPNYKILNRIIQVVKQAFTDKTDQGDDDQESGKKGD